MKTLILTLAGKYLFKRATRSLTGWIAGAVVAAGTSAAINPEVLELIPENFRGYAIGAVGIAVLVGRFRREFMAEYNSRKEK